MPMTPEVKKAIENIWDHRNIHLGDTRIPCDGEVIKNYIDCQDAEVERLRDAIRKDRSANRNAIAPMCIFKRAEFDLESHKQIFGGDYTGEINDDVLKMIYGRWWR